MKLCFTTIKLRFSGQTRNDKKHVFKGLMASLPGTASGWSKCKYAKVLLWQVFGALLLLAVFKAAGGGIARPWRLFFKGMTVHSHL
jgi:hypothetical protein